MQIFHDFHLILTILPNKRSLLNKIGTVPTFLVEKNKFPTQFLKLPLKHFVTWIRICIKSNLDPDLY